MISKESKSVGAEVNWGVRFRDFHHTQHFLLDLYKEVSLCLQGCVQGRTFTLKIKKRRKGAGDSAKYMGCEDCDNLSHSTTEVRDLCCGQKYRCTSSIRHQDYRQSTWIS